MKQIILKRLFESFGELERAIASARKTFEQKCVDNKELIDRMDKYEEILVKQRSLATALCGYAYLGQWSEVSRHIRLINGLSLMIRDDAREILDNPLPTRYPIEREAAFLQ